MASPGGRSSGGPGVPGAGCDRGVPGRHGEATRQEVLGGPEGEWAAKVRALDRLLASGRVVREGTGRKGDPYRFRLAPGADTVSVFPCGVYPAHGSTETQNRPEPASVLEKSRALEFRTESGSAHGIQPPGAHAPTPGPANMAEGT